MKVLDGLEGQVRWDPTFWLCVEDVIQECFLTGFMGWTLVHARPSHESVALFGISVLKQAQTGDQRKAAE